MDSLQETNQNLRKQTPVETRVPNHDPAKVSACATHNLSKFFPGVKALRGVSLEFFSGRVHALMGENGAGKSTLLKCLFGIYQPDEGQISIGGQIVRIQNPSHAINMGLAMVHQELHPIRDMTVMENLWLGRMLKTPLGFIDKKRMILESRKVFEEWSMDLDPTSLVRDLSVSKIQTLEIAKAVMGKASVIFFDEPTSSLSGKEVLNLYSLIERLKTLGTAIVYISHKMDEIKRLADELTVLRDGRVVGTYGAQTIEPHQVVTAMVGRELSQIFPQRSPTKPTVVLQGEGLGHRGKHPLRDVTFKLHAGEVLGIGGLIGSRRSELLQGIYGLKPFTEGCLSLKERSELGEKVEKVSMKAPSQALAAGISYLGEDRRQQGIFPNLGIIENLVVSCQKQFLKYRIFTDDVKRLKATTQAIADLRIKTPTPQTLIVNLSGGNQQKVLLARALLTKPKILLLDEPTRGVDVGAKHEIYELIHQFVSNGGSVIVVSSEMPELIGLSHRVLVLCEGRMTGLLEGDQITEQNIITCATEFLSTPSP